MNEVRELTLNEIKGLVRTGTSEDQPLDGEQGEYLKWRKVLAIEGRIKGEGKLLSSYVEEAVQLIETVDIDDQRVVATQLVELYSIIARGRLDEIYNKRINKIKEMGGVVPEEGSEDEFLTKVAIAHMFIKRITAAIRKDGAEDQVGLELEYDKRVYRAARGRNDRLPLKIERYMFENDVVVDVTSALGAWEYGPELSKGEIQTTPGTWKQQIREIAALVAINELQGTVRENGEGWVVHMTLPEIELSDDDTQVMWITPMLLALGIGDVRTQAILDRGDKAIWRERIKKSSGPDAWYKAGRYYPYHRVRDRSDMERNVPGVEMRGWLRVVIPRTMAELKELYKTGSFMEVCRQSLLAHQKGENGMKGSLWEGLLDEFKEILDSESVVVPGEGRGEMYSSVSDHMETQEITKYERLVDKLRKMKVMEPERFARIQERMRDLRKRAVDEWKALS